MLGHLDPANMFAMGGLNMAFATELHRDGKTLPKLLFISYNGRENTTSNQSHKTSSHRFIINSQYK